MSSDNTWIDSLFVGHADSQLDQQMEDLLTGELPPDEQRKLIKRIQVDEESIETFADIWDDLRPDESGLDPQATLENLLRLAEARMSGPEALRRLAAEDMRPEWLVTEAKVYRNAMLAGAVIPSKSEDSWLATALGNAGAAILTSWDRLVASTGSVRSIRPGAVLTNLHAAIQAPNHIQGTELPIPTVGVTDDNGLYHLNLEEFAQSTSIAVWLEDQELLVVTVRYRGVLPVSEAVLVITVRNRDRQILSAVTCLDRVGSGEWQGAIPAAATSVLGALSWVSARVVLKE